jgi:hypothetical protein
MMSVNQIIRYFTGACLLLTICAAAGCGGGNGDEVQIAETRSDGRDLSVEDEEAADFVRSKLEEHWVKGPDGWTTQFQQYNIGGQVMADRVPTVLYQQYRQLSFSISPESLTESMKLNGSDYRASVEFNDSPKRFFQTQATFEGPQGWGNWQDGYLGAAPLAVERRNGKWIVTDHELFEGIKPDPAAVASAGTNKQ